MGIWQFRRRSKSDHPVSSLGTYYDWAGNGSVDGYHDGVLKSEDSEVLDENHGRNWQHAQGLDKGGNFDLYRTTVLHDPAKADIYRPVGPDRSGLAYSGYLLSSVPPVPEISSADDKAAYNAAKLWNKARPAQPLFEGLNAFYELKDVPEMLQLRFRDLFAKGGAFNVYLAYQFGWAPLLRDVRDFYVNHTKVKGTLEQLRRDNGRSVRRKAGLKPYSFTRIGDDYESYGAFEPSFVTQCYDGSPRFIDTYRYEENVWLSGEYKYWLPPKFFSDDWRWTPSVLATLYGFNPTPYRVWKAIPWTWLVDWFSNTGQVLGTMSSTMGERLAADYCYVMCRIKASMERRSYGKFRTSNTFDTSSLLTSTCTVTREHMARIPAGVFGPMVGEGNLTPTQTDILGAIGGSGPRRIQR